MNEMGNSMIRVISDRNTLRFRYDKCSPSEVHAGYIFFGREFVMGTDPADFFCEYGYAYPFNMAAFFDQAEAALIILDDPVFKSIHLRKNDDICCFEFLLRGPADQVSYRIIPFDVNRDFLADMIKTYQGWFIEKYGRLPASSRDLTGCFNVKRYFFNQSDKFFGSWFAPPRAIFTDDEIQLKELIREDCRELGSIDAVLLFDYSFKNGIRCGNREPFPFEEEKLARLNSIINDIKREQPIHFFAYFDPCFVECGSDWDEEYRNQIMLESDDGNPVSIWGEGVWHPDLGDELWQEECSRYLQDVMDRLNADGVYLDEIGNGTQFKGRVRGKIYDQIRAEDRFVDHVQREADIPKWMCEYPPAASEASKFDIVLSDTRTLVNIYRFIFPELKFVRVINCDMPIGNSADELNKAFFNGEGLWLDYDVRSKEWYPDDLKRVIREQTLFKKKYAAFLESSDAGHCRNNGAGMAMNRFGYREDELYTVINESRFPSCGPLPFAAADNICIVYGEGCSFEQNGEQLLLRMPPRSVCAVLKAGTPGSS